MDFSSWMLALFGFCFMTEDELVQRQPRSHPFYPHSPPPHLTPLHSCPPFPSSSLYSPCADVFQTYDSTGTGRLLQNDLYKFMKQMHADNRQPYTPPPLRARSTPPYPSSPLPPSPSSPHPPHPPPPPLPLSALFPKDIVISMSAELDLAGYFSYDTFHAMTVRYPMLFYPLVRIQRGMRGGVIGMGLFSELDGRTMDVYEERRRGDRARWYWVRKMRSQWRRWVGLVVPWVRPGQREVEAARERRERVRWEKAEVKRRREAGVGGSCGRRSGPRGRGSGSGGGCGGGGGVRVGVGGEAGMRRMGVARQVGGEWRRRK